VHVLEEGEFISEEDDNFIETTELKEDDMDISKLKFEADDDENYRCEEDYESEGFEEEDFDELITEEMNQRAKKRKRTKVDDDDEIVFE
jgi:hypothetical protein